jgi:NAD(P)-dependent dehydrogenase (short-subunit alcohol dehydrogenase family)
VRTFRAMGTEDFTGKVALLTGATRGIGFGIAQELVARGASVCITARKPDELEQAVRELDPDGAGRAIAARGSADDEEHQQAAVDQVMERFGRLDLLVNNAGEQHPQERLEEISAAQLERTFKTNLFGVFHMTKAALPHLPDGAAIINTTSVTAYRGSPHLIDYAATKGAIVAFTRSLADNLQERRIRVNAVAPGPVWTPLIPASFPAEHVDQFGANTLLGRPAEPDEIAPSYIFLASDDGICMTGQVLHPNGGEIVGG